MDYQKFESIAWEAELKVAMTHHDACIPLNLWNVEGVLVCFGSSRSAGSIMGTSRTYSVSCSKPFFLQKISLTKRPAQPQPEIPHTDVEPFPGPDNPSHVTYMYKVKL